MTSTREVRAAHHERMTGIARLCRECGCTHREHVECPPPDTWILARTTWDNAYPAHLLARQPRSNVRPFRPRPTAAEKGT